MNIVMIGTGYVGLVTGACLANVGHTVCCLDTDAEKIENLRRGIIPIFEPGLEPLVTTNYEKGSLTFSTSPEDVIDQADIIFIAVGTPPDEDGSADLKYVLEVARTIGRLITSPKVIVDKSTVPVGTADKVRTAVQQELDNRGLDLSFDVCSNPEFLKEGSAVEDFNKPARIIVGTDSVVAEEAMRECYAPFSRNRDKLIFMDIRSAELTKYAANAMLATKISFINEMSRIAEKVGADIERVRIGIGSDPRIGYDFIYPGAGYGGSCFPKDVQALARTAQDVGIEAHLLNAVEQVNNEQKETLFAKLATEFDGDLKGKTIAVWGLAFKPNTDDMRCAPSRVLIESLSDAGAKIRAFDPVAMEEANRIFGGLSEFETTESKEEALDGSDALVICTEWNEFRVLDFALLKEKLSQPLVIDGRNVSDPEIAVRHGFTYIGVGRSGRSD